MAAIIGLEDDVVNQVCEEVDDIVVPANFNCPGQLVISGSMKGIEIACEKLKEAGARRALPLKVGGAFHSPFMAPAGEKLAAAIENTEFAQGVCPIYQNVTGEAVTDPVIIKENLVKQLTAPVRWTQIMKNMIADGLEQVVEVGPGTVLQGLFKKIDRKLPTESAAI
jgi:[acyl-carrier-protein] S-malonyltransferase